MKKEFFRKLAEKENGKFYFHDENIALPNGVRSPNVTFKVLFDYKANKFEIENRTGTAYVGIINCKLTPTLQPIEFNIETISHLKNLILRKESRFRIKSDNKNIVYFLTKNDSLKDLSKVANKENFSPLMTCEKKDNWNITTKYHLEFDNWTDVVEPIIELYKNLIDEFEKRIANISEKAYREMN